jgi:hypothetical protein
MIGGGEKRQAEFEIAGFKSDILKFQNGRRSRFLDRPI